MGREVHRYFGLTEARNRDNANGFQTIKMVLLPVVYLNVMCCIIPHSELLATWEKKNSSCTLIKPLSYPGRGENVQVKKLNGTITHVHIHMYYTGRTSKILIGDSDPKVFLFPFTSI